MTVRRLVFAFWLLSLAAAAQGLSKPTAEIREFRVEALTLRDVTFLFELAVKNPYPVDLSFSGMTLDFSVEGARVFSAESQGGFKVAARKEKSNTFTVTLDYESVLKVVKDYASKEWLNTRIDGLLVIPLPKLPGLPKDIRFTYQLEKKIPAIKPRVSIVGFSVKPPTAAQVTQAMLKAGKKADPGKAQKAFSDILAGKKPDSLVIDPSELDVPLSVSFTIEIRNEAKASLSFEKLGYELYVNGEALVAGDSSDVVRDGGRTLVTVTNTFSSKKLSKGVKALFSDRRGTFAVKGRASVKLPDEIRKDPLPLAFDEAGAFTLK